jgi:hypothetical protein
MKIWKVSTEWNDEHICLIVWIIAIMFSVSMYLFAEGVIFK